MKMKRRKKKRIRNGVTKKDLLLDQIYNYRNLSPEAIDVLNGDYYTEKLIAILIEEGLIKKSHLKNSKKTVKKAGITAKIQCFYVTSKGKEYLKKKIPDEYIEEVFVMRKPNNNVVERSVKMTDTSVMAEVSRAYIVDEYTDDANLQKIVNENITHGVFITAAEAKKGLSLTADDVSHYKFTTLTGVLLTPEMPYFIYHAGNGFITQAADGERKIATSLLSTYATEYGLYPNIVMDAGKTSAIYLCRGPIPFARLVTNHYGRRIAPGQIFYKAHIIPVSRDGCNLYKKLIVIPDYKAKLIDILVSDYNFKKTEGGIQNYIPLEKENNEAIYVGIDFEINSFRIAQKNLLWNPDFEYKKMVVLCFDWQQEFYEEVINLLNTDKIICQPLDEDVLDDIIGFLDKIEVGKMREKKNG